MKRTEQELYMNNDVTRKLRTQPVVTLLSIVKNRTKGHKETSFVIPRVGNDRKGGVDRHRSETQNCRERVVTTLAMIVVNVHNRQMQILQGASRIAPLGRAAAGGDAVHRELNSAPSPEMAPRTISRPLAARELILYGRQCYLYFNT
ncbi:hypothetical protein EVAR_42827_1 [Eumeta japonica]|uniref:Uncharacterized protein n=1 Tax=Eumeta variegata TaxID=151549 RepID=A0A4C1WFD5_EUMVA|nr:hypothetical protein EVAR_42827_1 [Eumeta japonica]